MEIKNRQQMLTVVAIAAVVLFAGDKLVIGPLTNAWNARAQRIKDLRQKVSDGKRLVLREQGLRQRWEDMRRNMLPKDTSAAEQKVWAAFDSWAQDSRIAVNSITPQWKHDSDDYMTYDCRVEASGNLGTVSHFLYDIEKDPTAFKLESLELGARDKDGQQITLTLQLSGLVLTPQTQ
jgi:Tfp pilus assembly protein PilO